MKQTCSRGTCGRTLEPNERKLLSGGKSQELNQNQKPMKTDKK